MYKIDKNCIKSIKNCIKLKRMYKIDKKCIKSMYKNLRAGVGAYCCLLLLIWCLLVLIGAIEGRK